jgi:hypothetical protein
MQESSQHKELLEQKFSERVKNAEPLIEKWSRKPEIGKGLQENFDANPEKVAATAYILENEERHLKRLTETQISTAFSTTPENVMRIVRLGYPNSVRGEIFLEWAMETAKDSIYYLYPQYDTTKRGATALDRTIESAAYRFSTEIVQEACNTLGDGSTTTFTGTLSITPVIPFSVRVYVDNVLVGNDNGANVFPATHGGDNVIGIASGTVSYSGGSYSVVFTTAPAVGVTVLMEFNYNSEVVGNYTQLGQIELQLRDYQFRVRPYPLGVSWSKMTELLLGTTLNIDAEEALIRGAADELKKSLDFQALRLGYNAAKGNTLTTFDASAASAGEDSAVMRAQAITNAFDRAGDIMYNALQRGGVTKIYGGPNATSYLRMHKTFDAAGAQPKVGAHKIGSIQGIDIYKVPSAIVPNDELVAVYRNDEVPEDVSIAFGTLIPLYKTQKLEFKNLYSDQGLAHFGDNKILQSKYLARIKLTNLPTV